MKFLQPLLMLLLACCGPVATAAPQSLAERLKIESPARLAADANTHGDPIRGAFAFHLPEVNCVRCHQTNSGRRLGPNLAQKRIVTRQHLALSILHPSKQITAGFETAKVLLEDGTLISGVFVEETKDSLVIDRIEDSNALTTIAKETIEQWSKTQTSSMPTDLANQLGNRQQFLDLVAYLHEISIGGPLRAAELKPGQMASLAPLPEYESHIDHAGLIEGLDDEAFRRGEKTFALRCASCHGTLDNEGSMPTSLRFATGKFKHGTDPHTMYRTLTHGYGLMNAQRWMVPQQKYDVIHYIREHFLADHNREQLFGIDDKYLQSLPKGDSFGPAPVDFEPWTAMDYGPSFFNTIEVSKDGTNIAQKGITIRLNSGPGGVESGSHWMIYDHDTMRVAGAWSGEFINWDAIHFNGAHGRHPRVAGNVHFANRTGPGWGRPKDGNFDDNQRVLGRDSKQYGPLPRHWAQYRGMHRFGNATVLEYTVGQTKIFETPALKFIDQTPVFQRLMEIEARSYELVVQIANRDAGHTLKSLPDGVVFAGRLMAHAAGIDGVQWEMDSGNLRLRIPPSESPEKLCISIAELDASAKSAVQLANLAKPFRVRAMTENDPGLYPQVLRSELTRGDDDGPFAVDVFKRPTENPWNAQLRLTALDFLPGGNEMVVTSWDGGVWKVSGIAADNDSQTLQWRRIASGLFQPLGIRVIDDKLYVSCRDQLVELSDSNRDGEMDRYRCFNNDHQVTEHFHEFAMGLQSDDEGNFYYAKSARHARTAIVPHHGTLLKVSPDGGKTTILATGFRAANGVCLNPDGSFVVTDQEGHWNPKNRINFVKEGGFYGNMFGYHDVTDESDDAMEQPVCWITNSFDRSPSELLWVTSEKWAPLTGSLLNFSYGYGKVYIVPHEKVGSQVQGGMCEFALPQFPTGLVRGRFHPVDGQLYVAGMFAWAGSQQQPGGLYRIRYTGKPVHLPTGLNAKKAQVKVTFSGKVDAKSASDPDNWSIKIWDLKRSRNYGSEHYNEQRLDVTAATVDSQGRAVTLTIPHLKPTWGMEINYSIRTALGKNLSGKIHNSIHRLQD